MLTNVLIGLHNEMKYSAASAILRLPEYWRRERIAKERALELLHFRHAGILADHKAGSLPTRRTAAGALRSSARWRPIRACCCTDEPAARMNPSGDERG